jgi:amino acid adenylation domain-containing protein
MSSGESLPVDLEARFFARLGGVGCALHNLYGPTEASVDVTFWHCRGVGGLVPIGRPIGNTQIYLLDRRLSAVPLGVAGELYIGGVNLARGYGGRAELTAERFAPSPWGVGERLYRTGDLARYGRDGAIEYLGRTDHQVKVRGFRIELGEIEAVLGQHPQVANAVVVAHGAGSETSLVAYLVAAPGTSPTPSELRGLLQRSLPDFMVPTAFVTLAELPLTPSGKLDRRALPAPSRDASDAGAFEPPRTWTEEVLAAVWSEVLGVARVGRDSSFFDLGGHSLLATRLISRVRQTFRVDLPLRSLFATPALADFARTVDAAVSAGRSETPPIVPQARDVPLPLSFAQQRLWLIDQMEPGSAAYNMPLAVRLDGDLDPAALAWALAGVVRRHEVLRTTFHHLRGDPVQVIAAPEEGGLPLPIVDLSDLPAERRRTTGEALLADEAVRPFDLARGPLLRLGLLRLGPSEHLLLLTLHHIAADGWSLGILVDEMTALYRAGLAGTAPGLPELPVQYADFAVWQRGWLQGEVLESELSYWRQRLQGGTAVLELPSDRPRPAVPTQRGASLGFALDAGLSAALRAIGRRDSATPFMVLLATLAALLARYTGRDDVSIGSPMAGRNRIEIESLIGFFVNTLVLRIDLAEPPAFTGLLRHVREISLEAHAHQELPFERLVEELLTERNLSRSPLFQVAFVLQNAPPAAASPPAGLRLTPLASNSPTAKFDLTLEVIADGPVWSGSLEYACDLFDGTTAGRMLGHFQNLLAGIAADPERVLAALPILSAAEQHQTQVEWSAPATAYPRDAVIHELFTDQVQRTPDALAVAWDGGSLSYLELDRRANRLAHDLRGLGAGPETTVALCLERSAELIVAILGVLKAGGAYVPLDPALPLERLALILADVSPRALMVQESLPDRLSALASLPLVRLQADRERIASRDAHPPPVDTHAESLAYVMYTSGSTGEPKGVAVPHRAVVRLVRGNDYAELGPGVDFLQLAPASFDAATLEIWGPLLNGGRVVIPPPGALSLEEIGDAVTRFEVTALWLTAGLFHEMAESRLADLGTVRQLLAGGDVLSAPHARRVLAERPGSRLINGYGPTENTTFTCCHVMTDPAQVGRTVAIGRPIANTRVHLLDSAGRSVPIGAPGELWTGGDGLARGYLNRPGETADRWRPDAVSGRPGERLYATGDLARHLPDGSLEFLGRIDQQVKIRGFRVEPGEIEAALRDLAALDTVVVPREGLPGGKALVAYLAMQGGASPDVSALRGLLGDRLPDYMIPAFFVPLDALPLTANGKVDRRALASLPLPDQPAAGTFVAPRTPVQELLAGIFSEVLQLESIGTGEDFFALGGHSLLATQVISRTVRAFGVAISLRDLFVTPTVAGLASRVEELLRDGTADAAPPLVAVPHDGPLPLSYAQQRMWFLDLMEPGGTAYHLPFAVRMEGEIDRAILAAAWAGIVHRHEVLRTLYRSADGAPVQVIGLEGASHLTVIDLTAIGESRRPSLWAELRAAEASRPFDLATGPVARALLLHLGEGEHLLLLTLHHIAADGWSLRILVEELTAFYTAGLLGKAAELAPLTVQYADFAVWQRAGLPDEVLASELSHWRQRLGSAPAVLELPADRPRPPVRMSRGASRGFALEEDLSAALTALGRRTGGTPFLVFLAAFQSLLGRYTGQRDFNVGTPLTGRDRVEIEPLIGFFVNTLVLRANLAADPTFRQLIERVRETFLDAHSHQGVPFERLVEELAPERSLSHSPLFQVAFALQNAPEAKAAPPAGLRWSPLSAPSQVAKFDLTLEVGRQGLRWAGSVEYATDLFDAVTVERMLGHFRRVLAAVAADPERRLSEIPLLADWERGQLLIEWNDTRTRFPACRSVHELFRRQASLTPEALAVSSAEERLTYGELDRRANRLAHRLRALGVGPDMPVAVCMERSPAWIAALLGILKAGGAYVPLDPDYPEERLAFMVRDCGAQLSLVDDRGSAALSAAGTRRLRLDDEAFAGEPEVAPAPVAEPDHLAYVIYTSGSTGIPKGVASTHRGLLNLVHWHCAVYGVSAADRATQVASQAFDAAVWEIWPYLSAGASLRFVSRESRVDIPELLGELARDSISIGFLPTPLAEALLSESWSGLPALRYLLTGGDALERRPSSGLPFVLVNHYGPTEATVVATSARVSPDGPARPPIGRPIANTRLYVMDAWSQPSPLGVVGELCIAGLGLARGYVGRPDLTAERFVPDPFGCAPGGRLYRSGDLVRALPAGDLAFIGRLDHQVKVRGLRIELGEIEAQLKRQPGARDAVVLVREGPAGASRREKRLVAYVVPEPEAPLAADEIRQALRRTLPEHMVPATVVFLAALPLSPNGKVDRRALSASDLAVEEESLEAPRSAIEEAVAAIWADVLEREQVGIHSSFFDLGGHSLLATRVMSRVRDAFRVELPLRRLFEEPTVAALARAIEASAPADRDEVAELESALEALEGLSDEEVLRLLVARERGEGAHSG